MILYGGTKRFNFKAKYWQMETCTSIHYGLLTVTTIFRQFKAKILNLFSNVSIHKNGDAHRLLWIIIVSYNFVTKNQLRNRHR